MKNRTSKARSARSSQRGVVLLFALIALVILLIASVALVRSFNTSLFTAGNIAFKRDLQNQGERAVDVVMSKFRALGPLASPEARKASSPQHHYSSVLLPSNPQGIPTALTDSTYTTFAQSGTDIDESNFPGLANTGVSIKYLVERMCDSTTAGVSENVLGGDKCTLASNPLPTGTSSSNLQSADRAPLCPTCSSAAPQGVVYRLTVRVAGPRNTTSFFQSTFTIPSST